MRRILGVAALLLICGACGQRVTAGVGVARGSTEVARSSASSYGPVASLRLFVPERSVGALLAADWQPFRVHNPVRAEAFRVAYLLPSLQVRADRLLFRVGIGTAVYSFSGEDPAEAADIGPALGASVGIDLASGERRPWSLEATLSYGATSDFELGSGLLAIQLARYLR